MFEPSTVKELVNQAGMIGNLHGMVAMGDLASADLEDVVHHADTRQRLKDALTAAARDVGQEKAVKKAVRAARSQADAYLFVRGIRGSDKARVEDAAEADLRTMLN